ncbi:MAG: cytochrome B6 [Euryarchaeota archaeon]|jgi:cytochrome b6|nr:cytochrome B6 [Euryarchaeota archaeon]MED5351046.1 cytochrome b N-terminal domain-containing protein [Candidatus Thermoplasmatota archaeon]DAC17846.1 MAG TPA: cytochrome bc complex cytochrome b subunit [Candidatus Poseidoniales archaeon]HII62483.1 cytochrome bc complex cytochrome b subunit [Candidatus Poseidoniaceae archaeon]|tara:strand:- start:4069 stop:4938 length:870 start_codon:yes stop_codon:yes gene_type:complete
MSTFFWVLWFFIAFIIVLIALTLRKENEEMPRREILRAVESSGKMGAAERTFLWVFSFLDTRFRLQDYWNMSKGAYYNMHRQMPLTHAEKYKLRIIWYWYPLYCLGGISFLAFIILVITGTVLGIYYVPGGEGSDPTPAYASMQFIMTELPFGYIIRSVHHWTTHFMVAAVFLHMCRVYFTGAYRNPRELNWLIGVALMALTIAFGYSGYLLPWDSLAFGAATIGINMALSTPLIGKQIATLMFGGSSLSGATVTRMYFVHVFILPVVVTSLIIIHLFIVWVQGIAEPH